MQCYVNKYYTWIVIDSVDKCFFSNNFWGMGVNFCFICIGSMSMLHGAQAQLYRISLKERGSLYIIISLIFTSYFLYFKLHSMCIFNRIQGREIYVSRQYNVCSNWSVPVMNEHKYQRGTWSRKERLWQLSVLEIGVLLLTLSVCLEVSSTCSTLSHRDLPARNEILHESDLAHAGNEMRYARLGLLADSSSGTAGNSRSSPAVRRL
jgi:hypothetical protein